MLQDTIHLRASCHFGTKANWVQLNMSKNWTSPTKSTIKTVRLKTIFQCFVAKLEGTYWKKAAGLSDSHPSFLDPSPDLVQGCAIVKNPSKLEEKAFTPPRVFNQRMSPNKKGKNRKYSISLPVNHYFSWKQFWVFRGSFLSCLFFFSWEKRNPNEPDSFHWRGWEMIPASYSCLCKEALQGIHGSPNEMVEDIQVKNDGNLFT